MQTAVNYQNGHGLYNVITGLPLVQTSEGRDAEAKAFIFISFFRMRNKLESKISNFQAAVYYSTVFSNTSFFHLSLSQTSFQRVTGF
jgi:hypothetical protein